ALESVASENISEQSARDPLQFRGFERAEGNDPVEAVEEFGPEKFLGGGDVNGIAGVRNGATGGESEARLGLAHTQIGREQDDGLREIGDRAGERRVGEE